jgi:ElaB/YqjD/DUF883 family membrane-anchored ribosome-binding protein
MKTNSERLVEDMRVVIDDAEEVLKAKAGELSGKARAARAELKEVLKGAKETCVNLEEGLKTKARAADRTVRRYPYQAIGIGTAIGLLAGVLLARKYKY